MLHAVPTSDAEVYQSVELLPDSCRPCLVVREDGATLLLIDPRTTCLEAVLWCADNLTEAERTAYRRAYGGPEVGQPCPEEWLEDSPVDPVVPEVLCLRPVEIVRQSA